MDANLYNSNLTLLLQKELSLLPIIHHEVVGENMY